MIHITSISCCEEMDRALAFAMPILGTDFDPVFQDWTQAQIRANANFLLQAELDGRYCGCALAFTENPQNLMLHILAVAPALQGKGIGRQLVEALETQARVQEIRLITLGSLQSAEGFYRKLGYRAYLLIQSQQDSIAALEAANPGYPVHFSKLYDGRIHQLCLCLPEDMPNPEAWYRTRFPRADTQMLFQKNL